MPILQAMIGILWILLWALSASFLLSQVPEDYTPKAGLSCIILLHFGRLRAACAPAPGGFHIL